MSISWFWYRTIDKMLPVGETGGRVHKFLWIYNYFKMRKLQNIVFSEERVNDITKFSFSLLICLYVQSISSINMKMSKMFSSDYFIYHVVL